MLSRGVLRLQRTSRKGPGGWTNPQRAQRPPKNGPQPSLQERSATSRQYYEEVHPAQNNWKADKRRSGHMWSVGTASSRNVEVGAPQMLHRAGGKDGKATAAEENAAWTGGEWRKGLDNTNHKDIGVEQFSLVDREKVTLTGLITSLVNATFKPKDPDSRTFGGDGASYRNDMKQDLKYLDPRMVPYMHEELRDDVLKNIQQLCTPSGQHTSRALLKGRLVGLLFFTESERSRTLCKTSVSFTINTTPDFVVVAISLAGKEMLDITRAYGFYHCLHRDGAQWVEARCYANCVALSTAPSPRYLQRDIG